MYANQGVGLAAPQVGRAIRLVVIDLSGPEKREELLTLVNPAVVAASGEQEDEEGCLSVPNYRANVKRAAKVTVEATDLDGKPMRIEADELFAVCLQHEIEHLDGVLFIDHISHLKRAMARIAAVSGPQQAMTPGPERTRSHTARDSSSKPSPLLAEIAIPWGKTLRSPARAASGTASHLLSTSNRGISPSSISRKISSTAVTCPSTPAWPRPRTGIWPASR